MLNIAIGSDHAGYEYKSAIAEMLSSNFRVTDFGAPGPESFDYPDAAHPVAEAVESGECVFGILICGSGNGVCMTANKHAGIRAALCWNEELAALARQHNDANILCLPARFIPLEQAKAMVKIFLAQAFEGGRHANRVNKINC